jgi:hypothetical protein
MTDSFNIIMNPPYDGSLHLQILEKALTFKSDNGTCICLHPARWFEDPLWKYKKNSDHEKYIDIIKNLKSYILNSNITNKLFGISINSDMMISCISNDYTIENNTIFSNVAESSLKKILEKLNTSLFDKAENNKIDGTRCEIREIMPIVFNHSGEYHKRQCVEVVNSSCDVIFIDGKKLNGEPWYSGRAAGKYSKSLNDPIPWSIKFSSVSVAKNFSNSCTSNFYKNFIYLIKFDMHAPLKFIPYMGDYSHVWTDEDYCKFFGLTKEESEFMCRKVDDYRVKDFIKYEEI